MLDPETLWPDFQKNAKIKKLTNEIFVSPREEAEYHIVDVKPNKIRVQRLSTESKSVEPITKTVFSAFLKLINQSGGRVKRTDVGRKYSSLKQSAIVNLNPVLDWDETRRFIVSVDVDKFENLNEAGFDFEKRVLRAVQIRQGQRKLKDNLLRMYEGECCISGCRVEEVLQAAHLIPYADTLNNNSFNAILLKADLHDLFDAHLIGIEPEMLTVRISQRLQGTEYERLEGNQLKPRKYNKEIDINALKKRWELFKERSKVV